MTTLKNLPSQLNESTNADGTWQEAWSPVLTALSHFENTQLTSCQHELHRRYREHGLAFGATVRRQAGNRPWNLDLMPQMMAGVDWQKLERGLQQRARLKSALLKDLYGGQSVLREGIIPASLGWVREEITRSFCPRLSVRTEGLNRKCFSHFTHFFHQWWFGIIAEEKA